MPHNLETVRIGVLVLGRRDVLAFEVGVEDVLDYALCGRLVNTSSKKGDWEGGREGRTTQCISCLYALIYPK